MARLYRMLQKQRNYVLGNEIQQQRNKRAGATKRGYEI